MKLAQEIAGRIIGEPEIAGSEILIEDGRAEETAELLLLYRFTRKSENVAAAGEDHTGDFTVERGKENQASFIKGDFGVTAAKFDAIGGADLIGGGGVETQFVEGFVGVVGRAGG